MIYVGCVLALVLGVAAFAHLKRAGERAVPRHRQAQSVLQLVDSTAAFNRAMRRLKDSADQFVENLERITGDRRR